MPPTIPQLTEQNSAYPDAPAATDINPQRFGKDAAAMAEFGGEVSKFGNKLVAARKQAEDADAVANATSSATIEIGRMQAETVQKGSAAAPMKPGWVARGELPVNPSDELNGKMRALFDKQMAEMPSEEAKRRYRAAIEPDIDNTYVNTVKWENADRARKYDQNIDLRGDALSTEAYQNPSIDRTFTSLRIIKDDLDGHAGSTIAVDAVPLAYAKQGGKVVKSYFAGVADSAIEMSPERRAIVLGEARAKLKNLPPEFAGTLDGNDIRLLENQIDAAERAGKQNDAYNEALGKKALQESRDKVQNQLLEDIYEGKGSIKSILKSNLDPDKKQTMINVLNAKLREPAIPKSDALHGVFQRIHADPSDPKKITSEDQLLKEFTKGKLTVTQLKQARTELASLGTVHGQVEGDMKKHLMRQAEAALAKPNAMGMSDPDGQENLAKFNSYMIQEIEAQKKAGKPVRELLDANSPNYLGKAIANYRKTPQQIMKSTVERLKNQAKTTQAMNVAQPPKDTVRMLDPTGRPGLIPKANIDKALKRGFKLAPTSGRNPSSINQPRAFNPTTGEPYPLGSPEDESAAAYDVLLENLAGESYEDQFSIISRDDDVAPSDKVLLLERLADEMNSNEHYNTPDQRRYRDLTVEDIRRAVSRIEKSEENTTDEKEIISRNEQYLADQARETPKDDGKAQGKLPVLRKRPGTKAELEAIRKSKSGSLKVD